jgi:hypothetical protein
MKPWSYIVLLLLLILNSCFKEDDPVQPHQSGDVQTDAVSMTSTYRYQIYYDLGTGKTVKVNSKTDWDLAFSNADSSELIILNSSKFMWVTNLGPHSITGPADTSGAVWKFDMSSGNPDSNAIGSWGSYVSGDRYLGKGDLYVIDRGMDEIGMPLGLMRLSFDSLVSDTFYISYAAFNGSNLKSAAIPRNDSTNFSFFNLQTGTVADIEPAKEDWDLHFTQYTTIYFTDLGEPYPYLVTGVHSNRYGVAAMLDTITSFDSIDLQLAQSLILDNRLDAIGFDWKEFVFSQGTYIIRPNYAYIIRDTDGYLYKLRFISFINDTGEKGFPTFEFVRL